MNTSNAMADDDDMNQGTVIPQHKTSNFFNPNAQPSFFAGCLFQCLAPVFSVFGNNGEKIIGSQFEKKSLLSGRNKMGYDSEDEDEFASTLYGDDYGKNNNGFSLDGGLESILTPDEIREFSSYRDSNYKNLEKDVPKEDADQGSEVEEVTDQAPTPTDVKTPEPVIEEIPQKLEENQENVTTEEPTPEREEETKIEEQAPVQQSEDEEEEDDDPLNQIMANTVTDSDFEIDYPSV
jgi:hypothetical protein